MILLVVFAFLAGIITILSPCILPILPIVLSGSVGGGKRKPHGVVTGFILSFTFFTLFLSALVKAIGISADVLRGISIVIIFIFGISLLLPQFQRLMEKLFSRLSGKVSATHSASSWQASDGFAGGVLIGLSLGLIWTPCVGPILASVITLAATSDVSFVAFFITLAYSLGTAIPMFAVMYGGRGLLRKVPWLLPNTEKLQKGFGILMIVTAAGIFLNIDRKFQTYILETFPKYGIGLTKFEDNDFIKKQLNTLFEREESNKSTNSDLTQMKVRAPEIIPGGEWINTEPLTIETLKGKVVLIDFWTYTCINCQRTFPYLKDWHEKYKDKGLVIIGVHSPEFEFEKNPENVRNAISDFGLSYPIIQDNNFETWSAYSNRYWPAKYLIDKDGFVRYTHFGEGAYDETEKVIQELLEEIGQKVNIDINNQTDRKAKSDLSHETYLGYQRMEYLTGQGIGSPGVQKFTISKDINENMFSFGGTWDITKESAVAKYDATIVYNFNGKKVFLVMNPGETSGTVKVFIDGKLVDQKFAGKDVNNGIVKIDSDRLYELIDLKGNPGNHFLKLEFSPGVEAFAFTFG